MGDIVQGRRNAVDLKNFLDLHQQAWHTMRTALVDIELLCPPAVVLAAIQMLGAGHDAEVKIEHLPSAAVQLDDRELVTRIDEAARVMSMAADSFRGAVRKDFGLDPLPPVPDKMTYWGYLPPE